ncbi:hypothetical protein C0995_011329 [Termitomyces sp. Mi166|nr:hypothetical protein C0995_011329 [Termitomyces sp. Mi166\
MADLDTTPCLKSSSRHLHYDIVKIIIGHLDSDNNHDTRKNLLNAALVCKAFLEPALDSLWESMTTLLPLLKLLPTVERINNVYVISSDVLDDHWALLDFYGHRIKHYTLSEPSTTTNATNQLIRLRISPILPNLRVLCICLREPDTSSLSEAAMLVSRTLDSLLVDRLDFYPEHAITSFMFMLNLNAPGLLALSLGTNEGLPWCLDRIKMLQGRFSHLKRLRLTKVVITTPLLWQIGTLPIELLNIDVKVDESRFVPTSSSSLFHRLKFLAIWGQVAVAFFILDHVSSKEVEKISIDTLSGWSNANYSYVGTSKLSETKLWPVLMAKISSKWEESLTSLDIVGNVNVLDDWPSRNPSPFPSGLQHFYAVGRYHISHTQISNFISRFGGIERLGLSHANPEHGLISLSDLRLLVEGCPKLTLLGVSLNIDLPSCKLNGPPSSHGLRKLEIGGKLKNLGYGTARGILNINSFARFLDSLFPYAAVSTGWKMEEADVWNIVIALILSLQEVRREERIRWGLGQRGSQKSYH